MRLFIILCICAMLSPVAMAADTGEEKPPLDIKNGVWHIGFQAIFGTGMRRGQAVSNNLDLYPMFVDGKMVNALATSRRFNTSIHILESNDITVDTEAKTIAGSAVILMTPDPGSQQTARRSRSPSSSVETSRNIRERDFC